MSEGRCPSCGGYEWSNGMCKTCGYIPKVAKPRFELERINIFELAKGLKAREEQKVGRSRSSRPETGCSAG